MSLFKGPGTIRREKAERFWTTTSHSVEGLQEELNKRAAEGWEPRWVFYEGGHTGKSNYSIVFERVAGVVESETS